MNCKEIHVYLEVGGETLLEITAWYWVGGLSGGLIGKEGVQGWMDGQKEGLLDMRGGR